MIKKTIPGILACLVIYAWTSLLGQVGFNMEEKMMIEKFKFANTIFEDGKKQYTRGKFEKAEEKFKQCLERMPQFADASYFLAQIYSQKNELQAALESIEKAKADFVFITKFFTFSHQQRLDRLREQRDQLSTALVAARELLAKPGQPSDKQLQSGAVNQLEQQMKQIDSILKDPIPPVMETPADYFYVHGNIFFKMKRFADAIPQYREAIRLDPKHGSAYNNLINILFVQKNITEAMSHLVQAEANGVQINPKLKEALQKAAGN